MSHAVSASPVDSLYEEDLALWAAWQARLLREGRLDRLDLPHLIDEIEGVVASQREAIRDRLAALLTRLTMWKYQPGARLASWTADIVEERRRIARLVRRAPSLAADLGDIFMDCCRSGRLRAAAETGIDDMLFPEAPPFTLAEALDEDFLPLEPDLEAFR